MTHTVNKSAFIECFFIEKIAEICGNFLFVFPVFDILLYILKHLCDFDIRAAVTGSFQRTESGSDRRISIGKRRSYDTGSESRVITAAVFRMKNERKVEDLGFQFGELTVFTEKMEKAERYRLSLI